MPRLLQREGVLRFDTSVGGGRATTFSARRKVRGRRDSSNSAPKAPDPGPPGTRSQRLCALAGGNKSLESDPERAGTMTYLAGLTANGTSTIYDLSAGH